MDIQAHARSSITVMSTNRCPLSLSLILIFSSLVFVFCLWATPSQNSPVALKSSEAVRVDSLVEKFEHPDTPGVVVAVYRAGEIVYIKAVGMADLEHEDRLKPNSVFDIASMSKQFTAMAVVLLQLDGRLSLDDDVRKYVPEVHTDGKAVTIRQLLQHTSGIRDYLDLMDLVQPRLRRRGPFSADCGCLLAQGSASRRAVCKLISTSFRGQFGARGQIPGHGNRQDSRDFQDE